MKEEKRVNKHRREYIGNQGGAVPEGAKGPQQKQQEEEAKNIPNQDRTSAKDQEKGQG